jgi:hypothetical protein
MLLRHVAKLALRRLARILRLTFVVGIIPLLFAGCYRSFTVIDHLDVQSGWSKFPSLRLGSGDGGVFCFVSPAGGSWSIETWHDYDRDCPSVVMLLDIDTRGPGFDVTVGYFGLILLSALTLSWSRWRLRRARAAAAGGFEVRASARRPPI